MNRSTSLGAFARIFPVDSVEELARRFRAHSLTQVQLNLSTLGLPTIPTAAELPTTEMERIANTLTSSGLALWGVSATYNTAHPDAARREEQTAAAATFIGRLGKTGVSAATLCSGSRNPDDMWGFDEDTASESAWRDFRISLDALLTAAESVNVCLAIEPEPANTVLDVDRALRLERELGPDADRIGFILDPANLVSTAPLAAHTAILERAFGELGARTICVHAKDAVPWADTLDGRGVVDYALVAELYRGLPASVPFIIQDATEQQVDDVIGYLDGRGDGSAS